MSVSEEDFDIASYFPSRFVEERTKGSGPIISLANEEKAADAERVSEASSASVAGGTLDNEKRRGQSRRSELHGTIKA